ncbi:MAG: polysaccharide biosynthesis C-terminal domain-containing protein, partial [Chloroflexota bacterium]
KLQNDPARLSKAFEMTLWLILTLATPIALAIFVAAPDFLILLYGEKWLPSAILLRFLIAYSLLRPLLDDTGALFVAIGQPKRVTIVLTTQAALLILAATPLTLTLDAIGTSIGVGVAFVVGIALTYRFVSQTIPIDLARVFAPAIIAAAGSSVFYLFLARLFDFNLLPLLLRVIVKGGLAASIFFAMVLLLERRALFDRVNYVRRLLLARQ